MEPENQKKTARHSLRLILAVILNVALAAYVLPRIEHLRDIKDYRYVTVNPFWVYLTVIVPTISLLLVVPVFRSPRMIIRWLAIGLALFPACLAFSGWYQLLEVWLAEW